MTRQSRSDGKSGIFLAPGAGTECAPEIATMTDGDRNCRFDLYFITSVRKAGFSSNATQATYTTHARKYVTHAMNASDLRIASSSQ